MFFVIERNIPIKNLFHYFWLDFLILTDELIQVLVTGSKNELSTD